MPTYQPYSPDQAELLPAHVKDVLGADHLCFVVHEVLEGCDLSEFDQAEADEGGQRAYDPRMMLKIWLYGFCVNVRTTRKLEQRIGEDLGFRYLAGGATPDHKTLSEFHRRHREAMVEPVFGTLKQQRGMRQFERRGKAAVAAEWALASMAYNLTRYHMLRRCA
jgi:transposase